MLGGGDRGVGGVGGLMGGGLMGGGGQQASFIVRLISSTQRHHVAVDVYINRPGMSHSVC